MKVVLPMSIDQVFILLLGGICAVMGWFGREMYAAVNKLKDDLSRLEIRIGTDYVRYDRLHDALLPIKETLDEIKDALKAKADRQ